ncbi:hypothetical protein KA001_00745 [Patescibacteria group bacterium]|nr:hypothetical protein [Patescibacteria group bacterium]
MLVQKIQLKKILNSLGEYTLECEMSSSSNIVSASVPAGESAGISESIILPVDTAISKWNTIRENFENKDFTSLEEFDNLLIQLDGTDNKSNLGGNLTLVLSICFLKLLAKESNSPLYKYISENFNFKLNIPTYFLLIFEGGKHGSSFISAQEYMLLINNIKEGIECIQKIKRYLDTNKLFCGYGLEGAFTSSTFSDIDVLKFLKLLFPEKQIAIDIAESSRNGEKFNYNEILNNFNIYSLEDIAKEDDWGSWVEFNKQFGEKCVVIGDDLTTTNSILIQKAIDQKIIGGVIIKPNQIGTITETIKAVKLCKNNNLKVIVSHRGGDTNDDFIADLSIGVGADFVKFGGLQRGERICKYNRLEDIKASLVSQI